MGQLFKDLRCKGKQAYSGFIKNRTTIDKRPQIIDDYHKNRVGYLQRT
jgi:hypothetical protein